jgi:Family of unknown function (DUF6502)
MVAMNFLWATFPQGCRNVISMSEWSASIVPELLLRALGRLLRPLVPMLIRNGITYPVIADLLRDLYVDVALRDMLSDDKSRTDSRVSLLTGVHRKEIRRQRAAPPRDESTPEVVTLSSQIIARWLGAAPWAGAGGVPHPLPRSAAAGEPSFDGLVEAVTKDVRPRAVLDEWLSQDLVRLDAQDRVILNAEAFVPRPGRDEQMFYFGRNLHDHIAAAAANVSAVERAPFLDRSVHYDALPVAAAEQLEAMGREAAIRMLLDINRRAMQLAEAHDPPTGPTRRVNLGVYLFAENEPPATTSKPDETGSRP